MSRTWIDDSSLRATVIFVLYDDDGSHRPLAWVVLSPFGWVGVTDCSTCGLYKSREAAQEDCERLVGKGV